MKALIRNEGETVTEDMNIPCIDWNTGYPLTNAKWFGGPYRLVQNYIPPANEEPAHYEEIIEVSAPEPIEDVEEEEVVEDDDYVVIGGVRYSKAELRSLIE